MISVKGSGGSRGVTFNQLSEQWNVQPFKGYMGQKILYFNDKIYVTVNSKGLYQYDLNGNLLNSYDVNGSLNSTVQMYLCEFRTSDTQFKNRIAVGTSTGQIHFVDEGVLEERKRFNAGDPLTDLVFYTQNYVSLVQEDSRVKTYNITKNTQTWANNPSMEVPVSICYNSGKTQLFVAVPNGSLYVLDAETGEQIGQTTTMGIPVIKEIKLDSENNVYVIRQNKQLEKWKPPTASDGKYTKEKAVQLTNVPNAVFVDDEDNIYVGGMGGYFSKYDKDLNNVYTYTFPETGVVYDITTGTENDVYVLKADKLYKFYEIAGALYIAPDKKTKYDVYEIGTVREQLLTGKPLEIWEYTGSDYAESIAFASDGNVYAGVDNSVIRFNSTTGTYTNLVNVGQHIYAIAVDEDSNIFVGVDAQIQKISSEGAQLWSAEGMGACYSVAVDKNGYSYAGGYNHILLKYTPDGDQVWETDTDYMVRGIAVDDNGYVYTCTSNNIRVHSLSGSQLSNFGVGGNTPYCVTLGDGYVYAGCTSGLVYKIINTYDYNPGAAADYFQSASDTVRSVAVDEEGYIYTSHSSQNITKNTPEGRTVWKYTSNTEHKIFIDIDSVGGIYAAFEPGNVKKFNDTTLIVKKAAFYI